MPILITSDVHQNKEKLLEVIQKYPTYDHINSGDMVLESRHYAPFHIIVVKGNCDLDPNMVDARVFEIEKMRFLLVHGHKQGVKMGLDSLKRMAKSMQVTHCVFGHTHQAFYEVSEGITYINPGSLGEYPYRYALLIDGKVEFKTL